VKREHADIVIAKINDIIRDGKNTITTFKYIFSGLGANHGWSQAFEQNND